VIVVHCKAGKGRTGMMICALLVFLGMFDSEETARDHYDSQRAKPGTKALTINSQKRYVKFFEGFLHYKLIEAPFPSKSFFETALKRRNYMSCSGVFEDMENETLDIHSLCIGPFPFKVNTLDVTIYALQQDAIK
jgi:hypothetical protein